MAASTSEAKIEAIYIARRSTAPVESKQMVRIIPGKGIDGDRYANGVGTYSFKFMSEPGKQLTMVSLDGIMEGIERAEMRNFDKGNMGELRRNLVLSGISAEALNNMIGHEVKIGQNCRVFVHRRCVPCKYREAACKRPGLMNNLWDACGVNCEVLPPLTKKDSTFEEVKVGDSVSVIPNTYQPERIDTGKKDPAFFIRPADRTAEDVKRMIISPWIAGIACLIDPEGFQRVEDAYNSVGQRFWSRDALAAGLLSKAMRLPFMATVSVGILSIVIAFSLHMAGIKF